MTNDMTALDFLLPGVNQKNWQMLPGEQMTLFGLLKRLKPKLSIEVGVYYGGSLSLTAQLVEKVIAIDIDAQVLDRFSRPENVDLRIGPSDKLIPEVLREVSEQSLPLSFMLIDADHSTDGVRRDLNLVLHYKPITDMIIIIHDSGNLDCRRGILQANWHENPHVRFVDVDFFPGQIIESSAQAGRPEVWGGFALAYLSSIPSNTIPLIRQGAATSIHLLHSISSTN